MKRRKKATKTKPRDSRKDQQIRVLISILEESDYTVRHERLKRGLNWSVQSGLCEVKGDRVLFVDRTLSQDDQLDFLLSTIVRLRIVPNEEVVSELPESMRNMVFRGSVPYPAESP